MSRFDKKRKQRGALELEPPDEPSFATSGGRRMHRFLSENATLLLVGLVLFAFVCLPLFVVDDFFFVKTAEPERASGQRAAVMRKELARPAVHELFGHDPHAHLRGASNLTAHADGAAPERPRPARCSAATGVPWRRRTPRARATASRAGPRGAHRRSAARRRGAHDRRHARPWPRPRPSRVRVRGRRDQIRARGRRRTR